MRVLVVFPEVPRAVFTVALGWYRAIARDSCVGEVLCAHTRGYYGITDDVALMQVPVVRGVDTTVVISGRQVYEKLAPRTLPGSETTLVLTDEPYETERTQLFNSGAWSGTYSAVASNDSASVECHSAGFFLPCGFDDTVVVAAEPQERWDIGFVGSADERRTEWLAAVDEANPGASWCLIGPKWRPRRWSRRRSLHRRVRMSTNPSRGYLAPEEVASYYSQCRIVLNVHRGGCPANSPNPRTYDLLGYGIPAIQDERKDMPESVVQVGSGPEMGAFVRAFLAGAERETRVIAESVVAGRAIADRHSYTSRWLDLKSRLDI